MSQHGKRCTGEERGKRRKEKRETERKGGKDWISTCPHCSHAYPAVVVGVYQLVCQNVGHFSFRIDVVLAQHHLHRSDGETQKSTLC